MKNNRGFTLVEMLGVLIILIMVFMIVFPSLTKMIKDTNEEIDAATVSVIEGATADFLAEKSDVYPKGDDYTYCIALSQLIDNANLTEKQIATLPDTAMIVKTTFVDRKPVFVLTKTCTTVAVDIDFTLIGESNMSFEVGVGGQYVEPGATALNKAGQTVSYTTTITNSKKETVAYVDTTKVDIYTVKYSATIDGENYSIERVVKVIDTTSPTITVNPTSETIAITNDTYNVLSGVTASDNSGNIPTIKASTNLSLGQAGTYTVTYTATDSSGNKKTAKRTIIIVDATLADIILTGDKTISTTVSYSYTDAGATATDANGNDITSELTKSIIKDGKTVASVDKSGTYYITYNIIKDNVTYSDTRTVNAIVTDCSYTTPQTWTFSYTGSSQTFTVPCSANYEVQLWGAQGGGTYGAKGAYTKGEIDFDKSNLIYIYVGQQGGDLYGGYNGGANNVAAGVTVLGTRRGSSGGGATDIRLVSGTWNDFNSLKSRIMVSGAGGGYGYGEYTATGVGGGTTGGTGTGTASVCGAWGGKQTSGGGFYCEVIAQTLGGFGFGGITRTDALTTVLTTGGSGGGGYYGGGGNISVDNDYQNMGSGGGGSSFISGYTGCDAISTSSTSSNIIHTGQPNHYSGYVFTNSQMIAGNASMPTTTTGTETGHSGNGYAIIKLISFE